MADRTGPAPGPTTQLSPGGRFGPEVFFGLNRDGTTNRKGMPGLVQVAVIFRGLGDSCPTLVRPAAIVQRVLFAALAPIGRIGGVRCTYAAYSPDHPSRSQ